jgi:hypothetical protein
MKLYPSKSCLLFLSLLIVKVSGKCRIAPLSTRSYIPSDIIVSGTVKSFYMKQSGGPFAGKVKVKRVFRGDKGLEGRMVMVEGLGSKHICLSTPRLGDTKLFFLKSGRLRHSHARVKTFKLYSSMRKVNLQNLKALWKLEAKDKDARSKILILKLWTI